jgi:hypothetical protein
MLASMGKKKEKLAVQKPSNAARLAPLINVPSSRPSLVKEILPPGPKTSPVTFVAPAPVTVQPPVDVEKSIVVAELVEATVRTATTVSTSRLIGHSFSGHRCSVPFHAKFAATSTDVFAVISSVH